jgi:DNA helicase-2/ATP-dependent DNA helicase PcrA
MYVALTRARQRLYLSHAQTRLLHGQTRYHVCSRFVDELPEASLKWITPRRGGLGGISRALQPAWGRSAIHPPALPASAAPAAAPAHGGIVTGADVFHAKFGQGRVLAVEGAGADARAQVSFSRHGVKWLALAMAKLQVVSDSGNGS